jgi:formylglycine-generating enzyme required for sulfatase activity
MRQCRAQSVRVSAIISLGIAAGGCGSSEPGDLFGTAGLAGSGASSSPGASSAVNPKPSNSTTGNGAASGKPSQGGDAGAGTGADEDAGVPTQTPPGASSPGGPGDSDAGGGSATSAPSTRPSSPAPTASSSAPQVDAGGTGENLPDHTGWPYDEEEAKLLQQETADALGEEAEVDVDLGGGVKLTMVLVPKGFARLGTVDGPAGNEDDETLHDVTFKRPYRIGKTQLTRGQYKALMGEYPPQVEGALAMDEGSDEQPGIAAYRVVQDVVRVKLQEHAPPGWTFRLPDNDEWEYAARAGVQTAFSNGDTEEDLDLVGWYTGNSGDQMHDVGQKLPNAWGIHDMVGNNWHWIWYPHFCYDEADPKSCFLYTDDNADTHLVRGCAADSPPFQNACRLGNRFISKVPVSYRFIADIPLP